MPGVIGVVGVASWETVDAGGRIVNSGSAQNLVTNLLRSAFADWFMGGGTPEMRYLHFGTGIGTPAPTDTSLFVPITAVGRSAESAQVDQSSGIVEGSFTARASFVLGPTEMTGVITEIAVSLTARTAAAFILHYTHAILSAVHPSGTTQTWRYRLAMLA